MSRVRGLARHGRQRRDGSSVALTPARRRGATETPAGLKPRAPVAGRYRATLRHCRDRRRYGYPIIYRKASCRSSVGAGSILNANVSGWPLYIRIADNQIDPHQSVQRDIWSGGMTTGSASNCSTTHAAAINLDSSPALPMICKPIGSSVLSKPQGSDMAHRSR